MHLWFQSLSLSLVILASVSNRQTSSVPFCTSTLKKQVQCLKWKKEPTEENVHLPVEGLRAPTFTLLELPSNLKVRQNQVQTRLKL